MPRIVTFGPVEEPVRQQIEACQQIESGAPAVLCADNHLGYSMPIGGIVGYEHHVSPSAVGYDIACGNCAVRTDMPAAAIDRRRVMDEIWRVLSRRRPECGASRRSDPRRSPSGIIAAWAGCDGCVAARMIGSGNHYVDPHEQADGAVDWGAFRIAGFGIKQAPGASARA
jgi:tRNA-splicing ligase RtcB